MLYETELIVTPPGSVSAMLSMPSGPAARVCLELQFTPAAPLSSATAARAVILAIVFISVSSSRFPVDAFIALVANLATGGGHPLSNFQADCDACGACLESAIISVYPRD